MSSRLINPYRYAIYFAPSPDTLWWKTGSEWLGRCARSGETLTQSIPPSIAPEKFMQLTASPRRYGWHATMKAPFVLRGDADYHQLKDALALVCTQFKAFDLPTLQVTRLDDFWL